MIRDGDDGLVFPVGDTAALAGCLAKLADPARRHAMGKKARHTVETRFSERAMVERYENVLDAAGQI